MAGIFPLLQGGDCAEDIHGRLRAHIREAMSVPCCRWPWLATYGASMPVVVVSPVSTRSLQPTLTRWVCGLTAATPINGCAPGRRAGTTRVAARSEATLTPICGDELVRALTSVGTGVAASVPGTLRPDLADRRAL